MLPLTYTITIGFILLFPTALAILLRRRFRLPWLMFVVGLLTFPASQVVHIPLNNWLEDIGLLPALPATGTDLIFAAIILGLSAGLCEEAARALGFWWLRQNRRPEDGLMAGLGHGGIEAMFFGGVLMAASVTTLWFYKSVGVTTLDLSATQFEVLTRQMDQIFSTPINAFLPVIERLLAMTLHVILSLLVLQSFRSGKARYALLAIAYHALLDALLVLLVQRQGLSPWLIELAFVVLLIPGLLWLWRLWPAVDESPPVLRPTFGAELALFRVALAKELRQQWRTKRALIVVAVFLLFGLASPLMARFMPEVLKLVEGAEQFADLIPTPTVADAMGQYVKNLSQFGFILAIFLGMSLVVGEKEKGTAAMILSKPMPRWAFLLSKFSAQVLIYALAFLLASAGGYLYTVILFEPIPVGPFLLLNLLMWLWLLVFAAVTHLASTVASSTGAAAGLALLGSVILLVAGSIPMLGPLLPGGLISWAGQLGNGGEIAANGGAVAMSFGLILLFLVTALALFERQEL